MLNVLTVLPNREISCVVDNLLCLVNSIGT